MKCQCLFSEKNKKNISKFHSAEIFTQHGKHKSDTESRSLSIVQHYFMFPIYLQIYNAFYILVESNCLKITLIRLSKTVYSQCYI